MAASIAVVVPCHNGERYVAATLESALAQTGVDLEVLVVDDGSADRSPEIIGTMAAQDPRLRLIRQENAGVAAARNAGLLRVDPASEYVLFLDADDLLVPGALALLVACLEADPTLVAAVGTCARIDSEGRPISPAPEELEAHHVAPDGSIRVMSSPARLGYWHVLPITPISTPGQCVIRRSALPAGDAFDQACAPCEDWDLWLRLSRSGDIGVVHHAVLEYRDHAASASKRHHLMQQQRDFVFDRQRAVVADGERGRLRAAWRFGSHGFDARLCRRWVFEHMADRDVGAAARFAVRWIRYRALAGWSVVRRQPDVSRPAH